jgi:hypothetical protein
MTQAMQHQAEIRSSGLLGGVGPEEAKQLVACAMPVRSDSQKLEEPCYPPLPSRHVERDTVPLHGKPAENLYSEDAGGGRSATSRGHGTDFGSGEEKQQARSRPTD